jgi:trk system potassium uptake protein
MKIIIAGGHVEADFVIGEFKRLNHQITIINSDINYATMLSKKYNLPVFAGDPSKIYVLEDAQIQHADVFIALSENDTDNYVMSLSAKRLFDVKKVITIVRNPQNVKIYKTLGIDSVINATNLLVQSIQNESAFEQLSKTISLEDDKIIVVEIHVDDDYLYKDQTLSEIVFPTNVNISCIFRDPLVIIPKGSTRIKSNDKLIVVTTPSEKDNVISFFEKKK